MITLYSPHSIKKFLLATLALTVVSCSSISVSGQSKDDPPGFKYYEAKPYLVLEKGKEGTKARLVSLPDLKRPRYVNYCQGLIGSIDFGMKFQDGMLVDFNSKSDSQIDELVTGVASLGTAHASLLASEAAMVAALAETSSGDSNALAPESGQQTRIILAVDQAIIAIDGIQKDTGKNPTGWEEALADSCLAASKILSDFREIKYDPGKTHTIPELLLSKKAGVSAALPKLLQSLNTLDRAIPKAEQDPKKFVVRTKLLDRYSKALDSLQRFVAQSSQPEIYEILPPVEGDPNQSLRFRRIFLGN